MDQKKHSAMKAGIVKKKVIEQLLEAPDNRTFEGRVQVFLAEK